MHKIRFSSFARVVEGLGITLLVVLAMTTVVTSQTQITTGTIQGTVTDANGAIVPGANVEIKNLETNLSRTLTTDEGGRFVALALPPSANDLALASQVRSTVPCSPFGAPLAAPVSLASCFQ